MYSPVAAIIFFSLAAMLLPALSYADGLVPCAADNICTFCDFFVLAQKVYNFAIKGLAIPVVVIFIIWGGIQMLIAGANPPLYQKGINTIRAALIGLVIILAAWLIVDTVIKILMGYSLTGGGPAKVVEELGPWNEINCH